MDDNDETVRNVHKVKIDLYSSIFVRFSKDGEEGMMSNGVGFKFLSSYLIF